MICGWPYLAMDDIDRELAVGLLTVRLYECVATSSMLYRDDLSDASRQLVK